MSGPLGDAEPAAPSHSQPQQRWDPRRDDPSGANPVPWNVRQAIVVLLASFAAVYLLVVPLLVAVRGASPRLAESLTLPLSVVPTALTCIAYVGLRHHALGRLFGARRASARDVGFGLALGIGTFLVVNLGLGALITILAEELGAELPEVQESLREIAQDPTRRPVFLLSTVFLAPFAEELYYRGMLFQALRQRLWRWPAIGVSGLIFGLVHGEPLAILLTFAAGMAFAWGFARRGTLFVPIAAHAMFNLSSSIGLFLGFE